MIKAPVGHHRHGASMSLAYGNHNKHALPENDNSFGYSSDFFVADDGVDESIDNAGGEYSVTEEELARSSETNLIVLRGFQ